MTLSNWWHSKLPNIIKRWECKSSFLTYHHPPSPHSTQILLLVSYFSFQSVCVCLCVCMLVAQSCPTLCDPIDYSLPGFSDHGMLQTRILEWVAIPFSGGSSRPRDRTLVSSLQADSLPSEPTESIFKQKQIYILSSSLFCAKVGLLHTLFGILSFLTRNVPWRWFSISM